MDRLRPIRRIFHTLKGSGRLVARAPWGVRLEDRGHAQPRARWQPASHAGRAGNGRQCARRTAAVECRAAPWPAHQRGPAGTQAIADRVVARRRGGPSTCRCRLRPQRQTLAESEGEDEISRLLDAEAAASAQADASAVAEDAGTPANIDSVLREILEAEVEVHQATLQEWLRSAQQAPQPVSDARCAFTP